MTICDVKNHVMTIFVFVHHVLTILKLYHDIFHENFFVSMLIMFWQFVKLYTKNFHEFFCANFMLCDIHVAFHNLCYIVLLNHLVRHFFVLFDVIHDLNWIQVCVGSRVLFVNFPTVFASYLHMFGLRRHYWQLVWFFHMYNWHLALFWTRILAPKKKLGSIKWWYKKLGCMVNGLHGFLPCKRIDNPFCIHVGELVNMSKFV